MGILVAMINARRLRQTEINDEMTRLKEMVAERVDFE